tara:strand:- start:6938 stop:8080 length:1143 start_codon:yes stop_codon:yes gene_type:complete
MGKILVVGGGMAGWMTVLYLNKFFPQYKTTIIESKKIKTIGVGEGTTPNFITFLNSVGIDPNDFESKVNSSKKIGINFKNFNKINTNYLHDFDILGNVNSYALHFDSKQALTYLKKYALTKNISHILGEFENYNTDNYDLIFDCTGLNRTILKQSWTDCSEHLPFNAAIPFTIGETKDKTRTISTATDKGWIWEIPLNQRTGCGYVYNSEYNTIEEIKVDIKKLYPKANIKNKISFNPGYNKDVWVGDVISVGLSSGFFEPIEATSLMTTILQLQGLPKNLNKNKREKYNKEINSINEQTMLFIRHHYECDREDGLWGDLSLKFPIPKKLSLITKNKRLNVFSDEDLEKHIKPLKHMVFKFKQYEALNINNFTRNINSLI